MPDSSTDDKSGDGEFETGPSIDELFGDLEPEESVETELQTPDVSVTTQSAEDVFSELQAEASGDTDEESILVGETPDDIIESLEEDDPDEETIDEDLTPDEGDMESLLLTGRTEDEGFLWVDDGEDEEDGNAFEFGGAVGSTQEDVESLEGGDTTEVHSADETLEASKAKPTDLETAPDEPSAPTDEDDLETAPDEPSAPTDEEIGRAHV